MKTIFVSYTDGGQLYSFHTPEEGIKPGDRLASDAYSNPMKVVKVVDNKLVPKGGKFVVKTMAFGGEADVIVRKLEEEKA